MSLVKRFKVSEIQTRPDIQVRCGMNEDAVERYADLYREGVGLTPISIWRDGEGNTILIDGHHRLEAAKRAGLEEIDGYDEGTGDMPGFIEASILANARNGLALSKADRKRAAELLYKYQPTLSVRSIADKVGLSKSLIQTVISEFDAQTNAKCAFCRAKVFKLYAEEKSSGWIQTFDNGKEYWFCSEEHRAEYWAKVQEKAEAARLKKQDVEYEESMDPEELKTIRRETEDMLLDHVCPKCGQGPEVRVFPDGKLTIRCPNGDCTFHYGYVVYQTPEEAVRAWIEKIASYRPEPKIATMLEDECPWDDVSDEELAGYEKELKEYPCPYCGAVPSFHRWNDECSIACNGDCQIHPSTGSFSTFSEALEAWKPRFFKTANDDKPSFCQKLETFLRKGYCWSCASREVLLQLIEHEGIPSIGLQVKMNDGAGFQNILCLPNEI